MAAIDMIIHLAHAARRAEYTVAIVACGLVVATLGTVLLRRALRWPRHDPATFDWQNERPGP